MRVSPTVRNMRSPSSGNQVANQFVIETSDLDGEYFTFQSYDSVIVRIKRGWDGSREVLLDENYWDYSVTTGKYRNIFLEETKAETEKKIKSGEYKLVDLNA